MTSFYLYYIVIRRNSEKTVFISTKCSFMMSKRDMRTSSSEGVISVSEELPRWRRYPRLTREMSKFPEHRQIGWPDVELLFEHFESFPRISSVVCIRAKHGLQLVSLKINTNVYFNMFDQNMNILLWVMASIILFNLFNVLVNKTNYHLQTRPHRRDVMIYFN